MCGSRAATALFLSACGVVLLAGCAGGHADSPGIRGGDAALADGDPDRAVVLFKDAAKSGDEAALAKAKLANVYADQGRNAAALDAARGAIAIDPNEALAHQVAGRALNEMQQYAESVEFLRRAVELDPKCAACCYWLALSLSGLGRDDEAAQWWDKAAELEPSNTSYRLNVAINRKRRDLNAEAIEQLRILITMPGREGESFRRLVNYLYDAEQADEACRVAAQGLAEFPEFPPLIRLSAQCALNAKQSDEAAALADRAVKFAPEDPRSWNVVARVAEAKGDVAGMAEAWKKSLELDPDQPDERLELATLLRTNNRVPEAKEHLLYLASAGSTEVEVYYRLAAIHREVDNDLDKALAAILKANQLDPGNADVLEYAGVICEVRGEVDRYFFYYSEAIAIDPERFMPQTGVGAALLNRFGRPAEALDHFKVAARLQPEQAMVWTNLYLAHSRLKQADEAEAAIRRAVAIEPSAKHWLQLAQLLSDNKKPLEAVDAVRNTLKMEPGNVDAWNTLGVAQIRAGLMEDATESLEKAIALSDKATLPRFNRALIAIDARDYATAEKLYEQLLLLDESTAKELAGRITRSKAAAQPTERESKTRF